MLIIAVKYYAYGYLCNLLCLLGLLGNSLTLYILNGSKEMRKQSINIYLTVLALYDNGVLVFSILMFNLPAITDYQQILLVPTHTPHTSVSLGPIAGSTNLPTGSEFATTLTMSDLKLSLVAHAEARASYPMAPDIPTISKWLLAPDPWPPESRVCLSLVQAVHTQSLSNHSGQLGPCLGDIFQSCFNYHHNNHHNHKAHQNPQNNLPLTEQPTTPGHNEPDQSSETLPVDRDLASAVASRLWLLLRQAVPLFVDSSSSSTTTSSTLRPSQRSSSSSDLNDAAGTQEKSSDCGPNLFALLYLLDRQVSRDQFQQLVNRPPISVVVDDEWSSGTVVRSMSTLVYLLERDLVRWIAGDKSKRHHNNHHHNNTALELDQTNITDHMDKKRDRNEYLAEINEIQDQSEQQPPIPGSLYPLLYYVKLVYPLALISQTGSIWTTCLITIERYLAVCHPLMSLTLSTRSRAIWALSILSALAFLFNLTRFLEVDTTGDSIRPSELRRNKLYYHVYYICLNLGLNYILPLSLLSALNIKIYASVRYANSHRSELTRARQSELHLASMLVLIVAIFIACNAPAFLVNCLEPYLDYGTPVLEMVTIFSNVLVCFNSASNFVIYCIFGKKFRSKLKQALGLRGSHCTARSLRGCYLSRQYGSSPAITTTATHNTNNNNNNNNSCCKLSSGASFRQYPGNILHDVSASLILTPDHNPNDQSEMLPVMQGPETGPITGPITVDLKSKFEFQVCEPLQHSNFNRNSLQRHKFTVNSHRTTTKSDISDGTHNGPEISVNTFV